MLSRLRSQVVVRVRAPFASGTCTRTVSWLGVFRTMSTPCSYAATGVPSGRATRIGPSSPEAVSKRSCHEVPGNGRV
ncbi:MAG: hypothetical protein JO362_11875, partial [Streptomycetaceae bacterium]|nr:hypothetical protein [Streptomycetaceae bacterium]